MRCVGGDGVSAGKGSVGGDSSKSLGVSLKPFLTFHTIRQHIIVKTAQQRIKNNPKTDLWLLAADILQLRLDFLGIP